MRTEHDARRLLRSFLDVSLHLSRDLDVDALLAVIVKRAMELTAARYGAAGTLGGDGRLDRFLHRGLSPEETAMLPHYPEGKGLLGLVLTSRIPVRVDRISDHPASVGFPNRHVPMDAFLGVPMEIHGELIGALYLSKPPDDDAFSDDDEEIVLAMASIAAAGIQNGRLFHEEARRAEA